MIITPITVFTSNGNHFEAYRSTDDQYYGRFYYKKDLFDRAILNGILTSHGAPYNTFYRRHDKCVAFVDSCGILSVGVYDLMLTCVNTGKLLYEVTEIKIR